jgi:hypothetical protein
VQCRNLECITLTGFTNDGRATISASGHVSLHCRVEKEKKEHGHK